MYSFIIAIVLLVIGYLVYGRVVERAFSPDDRPTPVMLHADGVESVAMPTWRVFIVQFMNIAGTGPIFGAIMGAMFGTSSYLWIVFGCIFGGAVHDYLSGMLSIRNNGANLPDLIGKYLGKSTRMIMLAFMVILLVLVGAVFVYSPAIILKDWVTDSKIWIWISIIFIYFLLATILPIDKIIGRIYPYLAAALFFMVMALFIALCAKNPDLPEVWEGLANKHAKLPIFPCLFISIACGAISGFHATQSPLMARCISSEKKGRPVFYGAMISEGVIALLWAAIASYFFYAKGTPGYKLIPGGEAALKDAPKIVYLICQDWLPNVACIIALLGVIVAPVTTGATALRSARLIIADFLKIDQKPVIKRLIICIPLFAIVLCSVIWQLADEDGFLNIWGWFGWANQTLSVFTLLAITVYLSKEKKCFWISFFPTLFMTGVCTTFLAFKLLHTGDELAIAYYIGVSAILIECVIFFLWKKRIQK